MGSRVWRHWIWIVVWSFLRMNEAIAAEDDFVIDSTAFDPNTKLDQVRVVVDEGQERQVVIKDGRQLAIRRLVVHLDGVNVKPHQKVDGVFDANFDRQMFGNRRTAEAAEAKMNDALDQTIEQLNQVCDLTSEQTTKLRSIGRFEIRRVLTEIRELRESQRTVRDLHHENVPAQPDAEIQILRSKMFGVLVDEQSLYRKSLRSVLSTEQFAKYTSKMESRPRLIIQGRSVF